VIVALTTRGELQGLLVDPAGAAEQRACVASVSDRNVLARNAMAPPIAPVAPHLKRSIRNSSRSAREMRDDRRSKPSDTWSQRTFRAGDAGMLDVHLRVAMPVHRFRRPFDLP
jgi:hypothetical protein